MNDLIPENIQGKETSLHHKVTAGNLKSALEFFELACNRLLNPSEWFILCERVGAKFEQTDASGASLNRAIVQGDYIRIDIPGPGSGAGEKYDWVKVDLLERNRTSSRCDDELGIKLVACPNPKTGNSATAHFFQEGASSTFIISRNDKVITADYFGRNEAINNHTGNIKDNIRNTVIALGAIAGFSEIQWGALLKGFLAKK